ncbi:MAG TPA: hypothetical protein PLT65_04445 [Bacilli bacterium]|nr:hypothetical protein [Bacilli bacterium]
MLDYFKSIAKQYGLSLENVLSIALNRYGVLIKDTDENRLRFNLNLLNSDVSTYFAVCVNTFKKSPFSLKDNILFLENEPIGKVYGVEKDTCLSTYFRNDKKVITFNSNARSKCSGCKFCGTYSLTDEDSIDFSKKENIITYFDTLLKDNNISSMKDIENVTICTGCFESEDDLITHLLMVNEAFRSMNFNGSLNYIGSQLRDYGKIAMLSRNINNFGIYLTMEKFLDREKFMRPEKANLTLAKARELLDYCSSLGLTTTFLYILGLEDLETIKKYFTYFKDSINKFPIVQVFQNYTEMQELYRCEEAKDIEYYIKARKCIDEIFSQYSFNPKIWECFRSLYFESEDKERGFVKCKKKK